MAKRSSFNLSEGLFSAPVNATVSQTTVDGHSIKCLPTSSITEYHRRAVELQDGSEWQIFRDYPEEKLNALRDDIIDHGVLDPIIVFPSQITAGAYECLAGEHRTKATRLAKAKTGDSKFDCIPAIIYPYEEVSADDFSLGDIIFTSTNLHRREKLKVTEMALAYQRQFDALKNKYQYRAAGTNINEEIAKNFGGEVTSESVRRIRKITPDKINSVFLDLIDEGEIKVTVASQYLTQISLENQNMIYQWMLKRAAAAANSVRSGLKDIAKVSKLRVIIEEVRRTTDGVLTEDMLDDLFTDKQEQTTCKVPTVAAMRDMIPEKYRNKTQQEITDFIRAAIEEYVCNHREE